MKMNFEAPEIIAPGVVVHEMRMGPEVPFQASLFTVEPGTASPVDSHAVHEMWLLAIGEGMLVYDGIRSTLRAGDVVRFDPFKQHQIENHGDISMVIYSFWWKNSNDTI